MSTKVESVFTTPATFMLGGSLSGSWETVYDSTGAIASVTNVQLTLTEQNGQTDSITSLSIVVGQPSSSFGLYELGATTSDGMQLSIAWAGGSEYPTALADYRNNGSSLNGWPLQTDGVIQSTAIPVATWTGGGYLGGWETGWNWASGTVPHASDDVLFDGGKYSFAPSLYSLVTVQSVTIDNGAVLTLAGGALNTTGGDSGAGVSLDSTSKIVGSGDVNASLGVGGAGTIEARGGTLKIDGQVSGALKLQIDANATLELTGSVQSASGAAPTATFNGGDATLDLSKIAPANLQLGTIANFDGNAEILLQSEGASDTLSYDAASKKLTVSDGAASETFQLAYTDGVTPTAGDFHLSESVGGVDTITICFMAGTMIATPDGEAAVETLQRGDLVLTADGVAAPVRWLGRQTIASRFADPVRNWPVRVMAGALGDNMPRRDLRLSPDHALLVEGVLVHAGALVNGASIIREPSAPESFVYYHVELDDHALILVENVPAETFIDNVERKAFDNWAEHEALYPQGKPMAEMPWPRAKARRQIPQKLRVALDQRAALIAAPGIVAA